jgi:hypothetical protein
LFKPVGWTATANSDHGSRRDTDTNTTTFIFTFSPSSYSFHYIALHTDFFLLMMIKLENSEDRRYEFVV